MNAARTALFVVVMVSGLRVPIARAQAAAAPEPGRFEVAFGPVWIGRQALGSTDANETTGTGGSLRLFATSTELAAAPGIEGRVAVRVWRSISGEASATYTAPQIRTEVSSDSESAASLTSSERIQQFTIGGGIVWSLPNGRPASRLTPFVTAGAGYLRQLHDAATLVETGRFYQFGGGAKYLFVSRPGSHLKGIGARVDVRAVVRQQGVAFDDGRHVSPAIGASLFCRF